MKKPKAGSGSADETKIKYRVTRAPAPPYTALYELTFPDLPPEVRAANEEIKRHWMEGIRAYLASIGREGGLVGGKASTPAKRRAARENGKKGGRPRKKRKELGAQ
ncbi:MAG: hypothetical protein WBQ72_16840 [Terriglobales bacterium]|jgi:hypothetical protein